MTTMNDLFDRYENECLPLLQWRTQRDYHSIIIILRRHFGQLTPREVTPRKVVDFLEVKTGRVHRNRMVTILSTVFKKAICKWCIEDDMRNPCTGVERWPMKPRSRYVTDAEFAAFRETVRPQVQMAMDLALFTGQRQGDIIGLMWERVKTEGPRDRWHIEIDQSKTGRKLAIAISPAIEAVLDRAWLAKPHWPRKCVIRTKHGLQYTGDGFRAMWQRYMREWIKAGNEDFHFHDLRAKAVSDNQSLEGAYLLAGHTDSKMTRKVYDRSRRMVQPLR